MAEPHSQDDGASGKKYLRKGKKCQTREEERKVKVRNSSLNTKVGRKRGGGTPGAGEDHNSADIHTAACRGPHARTGRCALKEAAARGEPTLQQVYPEILQGKSVSRKEEQKGTVTNQL